MFVHDCNKASFRVQSGDSCDSSLRFLQRSRHSISTLSINQLRSLSIKIWTPIVYSPIQITIFPSLSVMIIFLWLGFSFPICSKSEIKFWIFFLTTYWLHTRTWKLYLKFSFQILNWKQKMIITHSWNKICLYTALTARRNSTPIKSGCSVAISQDAWVSKYKSLNTGLPKILDNILVKSTIILSLFSRNYWLQNLCFKNNLQ